MMNCHIIYDTIIIANVNKNVNIINYYISIYDYFNLILHKKH